MRNFISNPTRATVCIDAYIEKLKRESTELADGIFDVERQLEQMRSSRISQILDMHT